MLPRLKELRQKTGISQQTLADVIHVSQQSINKYENHNVDPSIETLKRISQYFCVSIDYLVENSIFEDSVQVPFSDEQQTMLQFRTLSEKQKYSIRCVIANYHDLPFPPEQS